jgi:hypothetical protein
MERTIKWQPANHETYDSSLNPHQCTKAKRKCDVNGGPVSDADELNEPISSTLNCSLAGRTGKTLCGARQQTITHSVLQSVRQYLPEYTLGTVVVEIIRFPDI